MIRRRALQRRALLFSMTVVIVSACTLAGDVTPPPAVATAAVVRLTSPPPTAAPLQLEAPQALDPEAGAVIYSEKCLACHGPQGLGDGPQSENLPNPAAPLGDPDLARQAQPADWYSMVTVGNLDRFMPGFSSLSDQERWDVTAYALTLSLEAQELEQGQALYFQACAACHGEDGSGGSAALDMRAPQFQVERSLEDLAAVIRDGLGPEMPAFGETFSEGEIWALAGAVRGLGFIRPTDPLAQSATSEAGGETTAEPAPSEAGVETEALTAEPEAALGGVIRGRVANASADSELPADLEITLFGFDGEEQVLAQVTTVEADGSYVFEDLAYTPGRLYFAGVEYGGVPFRSEVAHLEEGGPALDLPLTIFETSSERDALQVDRLHLLFDFPLEGVVRVLQLWVVSNPTDRVLAAPEGDGLLSVSLPEGATNLQFEEGVLGGRFQRTQDGFVDTAPIYPGASSSQIVFSFDMLYDRQLDYRQPIEQQVGAVIVLMPPGGPDLEADGAQDLGVRDMGGTQLQDYRLLPPAAGGTLSLTLSGRISSGQSLSGSSTTNLLAGLGVLLVVVAGIGWWWSQNRVPEQASATPRPAVDRASAAAAGSAAESADLDRLLDSIAELDDAYQAGALPDEPYHKQRADLKRRALAQIQSADD